MEEQKKYRIYGVIFESNDLETAMEYLKEDCEDAQLVEFTPTGPRLLAVIQDYVVTKIRKPKGQPADQK